MDIAVLWRELWSLFSIGVFLPTLCLAVSTKSLDYQKPWRIPETMATRLAPASTIADRFSGLIPPIQKILPRDQAVCFPDYTLGQSEIFWFSEYGKERGAK